MIPENKNLQRLAADPSLLETAKSTFSLYTRKDGIPKLMISTPGKRGRYVSILRLTDYVEGNVLYIVSSHTLKPPHE